MTDLISKHSVSMSSQASDPVARASLTSAEKGAHATSRDVSRTPDVVAFIELLFFAYRDFVHDPDAMLEEIGFGRAHHRVLHFVYRHPGIRVSRLLSVLNITKQSLARVLRQLIEENYVEQREGKSDRRERCLFLTPTGVALFERLVAPQQKRVAAALAAAEPGLDHSAIERFLHAMIEAQDRDAIKDLIKEGAPVGISSAEAA